MAECQTEKSGLSLRPTELLLFGKPEAGTHFITCRQTAGVDLSMKMLARKDKAGQVWLGYNDPAYIARRHGITDRDKNVTRMGRVLDNFSRLAAE